jgi:acyl-[acyl-carrier-protein] desaturase
MGQTQRLKITESTAQCVEIFCSEELYVPDYSSKGLEMVRSMFGVAWFQTCWAFEESRHPPNDWAALVKSARSLPDEIAPSLTGRPGLR